ncbi:PEGA domain-containing protein [Candidatus Sumerlaeota bacterium]|nr:PEGA domain-containing protein [Candidatus Sumerlaeota bacterium]
MKKFLICIVFILILITSGCIRSRVVVTSQPSGADVTINNAYRGKTPIIVPFGWYWYYDFVIEKEGYQKIKVLERFHTPVWCWIPLDLVMEAIPINFYDTKHRKYTLKPVETP